MALADNLEQKGLFHKAIAQYTIAFAAVAPSGPLEDLVGRNCLCVRSRCYLQVGDHESALKDADLSLKEDKTYIKGLFAKAEALYFKGDFEFALVCYHRGNKLRTDLQEFRLGIQKASEAILNAVGSPEACKLQVPPEVVQSQTKSALANSKAKAATSSRTQGVAAAQRQGSDRSVKQLLGELYADRHFLEELLAEPWMAEAEEDMTLLAQQGVKYLDTRADFWRQQKPIYAREHETKVRMQKKPLTINDPNSSFSGIKTASKESKSLANTLRSPAPKKEETVKSESDVLPAEAVSPLAEQEE